MNDYLTKCVEFLRKINTEIQLPERSGLEMKDNNTINIKLSFVDSFSQMHSVVPDILETSIFFTVFDSYFEAKNPSLEGASFRSKYLSLPKNNNLEKIVASVYKILKVYRNATVHHFSSIVTSDNLHIINYSFNGTNFKLEITNRGIKILKSFILCFFYYYESLFSDSYLESLFNGYYANVLGEIQEFNDEDGSSLIRFPDSICSNRYDCDSIKYSISNGELVFRIPDKFNEHTEFPIDIKFTYNGKVHILPVEVLNGTKRINIDNVRLWETRI